MEYRIRLSDLAAKVTFCDQFAKRLCAPRTFPSKVRVLTASDSEARVDTIPCPPPSEVQQEASC